MGLDLAYHDDLLRQARLLVDNEPRRPKQASLRRSGSTAYYAVFHLLVHAASANWKQPELRAELSRAFDHQYMKVASNRLQDRNRFPYREEDPRVVSALRSVARTFSDLQKMRHDADYDNTRNWTKTDALRQVQSAEQAFEKWQPIRTEKIAQSYLLSLLVKRRD